jgi:putative FmdB family regulatory protein
MPLYEYQCELCAKRFERIQKFSDPPIETCPSCGGHVKKLMSSPAIHFKGSGFYITDYPKKSSTDSTTSSSESSASAGEKPAGEKSAADKPSGDKPAGDKPSSTTGTSSSSTTDTPARTKKE